MTNESIQRELDALKRMIDAQSKTLDLMLLSVGHIEGAIQCDTDEIPEKWVDEEARKANPTRPPQTTSVKAPASRPDEMG